MPQTEKITLPHNTTCPKAQPLIPERAKYEFLIKMVNGHVRVDCQTSNASIGLYGAYLITDEVEDILDHLSLTINE